MDDINVIRGAILVGLIVGFLGICWWAWSRKRKPDFEKAARLPLEEDEKQVGSEKRHEENEE